MKTINRYRHNRDETCGEASLHPARVFEQDRAFMVAMRRAVMKGKENAPIGARKAKAEDARYTPVTHSVGFVFSASSIANC